MFFNPLFLQVINNQETLTQGKPQKLNGSSYLFSDIIKVQLDKTDISMPENDLEAAQSVSNLSQTETAQINSLPGAFSPLMPQAGRSRGLLDSIVSLLPSVIKQKNLAGSITPQTISNFIGSFNSAVSPNLPDDLKPASTLNIAAGLISSDLSSSDLNADKMVIPLSDADMARSAETILNENESGTVMLDSDALSNFIAGLVNGSSFSGKISLIVNGEHASEKSAELINNLKEHRITAGQLLELLKDGNTISLENPEGQKEQGLLITLIEKNPNGSIPNGNYEALKAGINNSNVSAETNAEVSESSKPGSSEKKIYVNADETVYEIRLSVIEASANISSAPPVAAGISALPSNDYDTIVIKEAAASPDAPGSNMPAISNTIFDSASGYELLADNSGRFTPGMFINSSFNRQMAAMNAPDPADNISGESNFAEIINPAGENKIQSENIVKSESNDTAVNNVSVKSGNAGPDEIAKAARSVSQLSEGKTFEEPVKQMQTDAGLQQKAPAAALEGAPAVKQPSSGSPEKSVSDAATAEILAASSGVEIKDLNIEELSYTVKSPTLQAETKTAPNKTQQVIIPSVAGQDGLASTPETVKPERADMTPLGTLTIAEAKNQAAQKNNDTEIISLPFSRKLDRIKLDTAEPKQVSFNEHLLQSETINQNNGKTVHPAIREKSFEDKITESGNSKVKEAEAKIPEVKPSEVKTAEAGNTEVKGTEIRTSGAKTGEIKPAEAVSGKTAEQRTEAGINSAEEKISSEAPGKSSGSISSGIERTSAEGSSDSHKNSQFTSDQKEHDSKGDNGNSEMHRKAEGANTFQTEIHKSSDVTLKVKPQNEAHAGHNALRTVKAAEIMKEAAAFIQQNESRTLVLKVDPEYLGKIKIALEVTDSLMHASIEVENEAAKKVVENNINQLYSTLNQNGVQVQSLNISLAGYEQKQNKPQPQKKKFSGMSDEPEIEEKNPADEKQLGYNTYEYLA